MNTEIVEKEKIVDFINRSINYLKGKLNHLGRSVNLIASYYEDDVAEGKEIFSEIPNRETYKKIETLMTKRIDFRQWKKRLQNIVKSGVSDENIFDVLAPRDGGIDCGHYLLASIFFRISERLSGTIEFFREYQGEMITKEFVIIQYRIDFQGERCGLVEISDWEDTIALVGRNVLDFERDPSLFIEERITKFLVTKKTDEKAEQTMS